MVLALRERLLLWWGRRHIGEMIRRRALRRAVRGALRVHLKSQFSNLRFLDAGCGRGDAALWVVRRWPDAWVDAVDSDPALVALVERRVQASGLRNVRARVGDITTGQSAIGNRQSAMRPEGAYGIIYSVDVFEHLRDPAAALRNLAAHLADDGRIILHVPRARQRRSFPRFAHYDQHDHEREGFEPEELAALVSAAGLTVVSIRHTFGSPGALAWELFHLAQGVGKWLALLTYPLTWFLAQVDGCVRWRRGNGILIVARKCPMSNEIPITQ